VFLGVAPLGGGSDTTQQGLPQLLRTFYMLFRIYIRSWGQLPLNSIAENQKMRSYLNYRGSKL